MAESVQGYDNIITSVITHLMVMSETVDLTINFFPLPKNLVSIWLPHNIGTYRKRENFK